MNDIRALLDLERWPDLQRQGEGFVAIHEPEKAEFYFKIKVNDPLPQDSIEKIVMFGAGADPVLIRHLFSLCNGLWIAKFAVYGLLSGPRGLSQPWDINVPNCYRRPEGFPEDYLIVGVNQETDTKGKTHEQSHCITGDGRIVVIELEKHETILREYRSIEDWLKSEAKRALVA
ncbi:hypothetical protein [Roseinatronobacter alkalisoli]|uniref:Uncharacterized protein n=1 Tax=Roseinatronobacter alkalisoli TaxID=3028235 RepID=A0ABT5TFT4_9RHOB|nr:hypothetical protein [Roseinatronobacter sp. HJB301]MDD7973991.1 hypothetical protein [Roseinatronobacter sp. HJB301]